MIHFLTSGLVIGLAVLGWGFVDFRLQRRFACKCGRSAPYLFNPQHESSWYMLAYAILEIIVTVVFLLDGSHFVVYFFGLLSVLLIARWWKHESGNIKRRAKKALGSVSINNHGRLVVR